MTNPPLYFLWLSPCSVYQFTVCGERKGVRNEWHCHEKKRCQDPFLLTRRPGTAILLDMGRPHRLDQGGYVYHVLNRANARLPIFQKDGDYDAFERITAAALDHVPGMRLLAYCLMPNHWHLLLWPRHHGELADFVHWLTLTHTQRWHAHYHDVGSGHLYQGRYKSFPVQED